MDINDEILNALRGSYKTSFYSIYLNGTYNEDFTKMSQADQGTLVHEYIHFLQNISTPWGLYMSMTCYNLMFQSLHEIVANNCLSLKNVESKNVIKDGKTTSPNAVRPSRVGKKTKEPCRQTSNGRSKTQDSSSKSCGSCAAYQIK